jgi:hypothetical protein
MSEIVRSEHMTDAQRAQSEAADELTERLLDVLDGRNTTTIVNALVRALVVATINERMSPGALLDRVQSIVNLYRACAADYWQQSGGGK